MASLKWLAERDPNRTFLLMCHHKAPHRPWHPSEKYADLYEEELIPFPKTFNDTYENRSNAAREAQMRVYGHMNYLDLKLEVPEGKTMWDFIEVPEDLTDFSLTPLKTGVPISFQSHQEVKEWMYQCYIKDYLRCVTSIDDSVGQLLDYLDTQGLTENTIVVYTSDQGFFLGDHGWYDKRFMYEESLRMPFLVRYPKEIAPGSKCSKMALNLDFAQTFLDYAGVDIPQDMQGVSLRPLLQGKEPANWRTAMYYRYWMHLTHHYVSAHYGIRTERYKLIYYYGEQLDTVDSLAEPKAPEWELFDLKKDPPELNNVYHDPKYEVLVEKLKEKLYRLKEEALDFQ